MWKSLAGAALLMGGTNAWAASPTDFGVRPVSGPSFEAGESVESAVLSGRSRVDIRSAALVGSRWGRVTSTWRSPEHNRRVGGVRNSFHLRGRAIDIARRPGVTHAQIAAAFRNAGYYLVESLDEGDHSHFAFGSAPAPVYRSLGPAQRQQQAQRSSSSPTQWRVVTASSAIFK